jgi:hypothetical protein
MKHQSPGQRRPKPGANPGQLGAIAAVLGTMLWGTDAEAQESAFVEESRDVTATVTAVDPETRLVSLKSGDGEELTVQAGPEVRNFDQIETGDRVDVVYYEAIAAEVTDAPQSAGPEPMIIKTTQAPLGDKPEGTAGLLYTAVVTIEAIDKENNTVKFTAPGGQSRELAVVRPEMQEFVARLNPGDRVQVTYGEALAVSVSPTE